MANAARSNEALRLFPPIASGSQRLLPHDAQAITIGPVYVLRAPSVRPTISPYTHPLFPRARLRSLVHE